MEHFFIVKIMEMIRNIGDLGVFIAMFLESSIVPIPSEAVIITAGAAGIPLKSIIVFGALGSTVGAIVGYGLGRFAALPIILKFGKYVFIKPEHIIKAENFAKKYGVWGVLIGRVLPIIPFKVFSIASGLTEIPFIPFVICTFAGVIPRLYVLALFGTIIVKYQTISLLVLAGLVVLVILWKLFLTKSKSRI